MKLNSIKNICIALVTALICGIFIYLMFFSHGKEDEAYVYYINFKPEADEAWQKLAEKYTSETGVPVKIVTAASNTYSDTLAAQLNKNNCPTLFVCNNAQGLENMGDYPYDLRESAVAKKLENTEYCLWGENGEMFGIGYCFEAYGIITNKALLEKAGYSISDIHNFETLKTVAEDIHSRRDELGFDAFTSSGLDASSSWRFSAHLANIPLYYEFTNNGTVTQPSEVTGDYLDLYKNIWDLYINNGTVEGGSLTTATGNMAEEEFGTGKAVFFQNGSWEYSSLIDPEKYGMKPEDITMIPIYSGADDEEMNGLCCGTENYWVVNSKASQKSIDATLDFLDWVVSSDYGKNLLSNEFGVTPFKDRISTDNVFFKAEEQYEAEGKHPVTWAFCMTPNTDVWREGVTSALAEYSAGTESWDNVKKAFINGWKYQYRLEHGIME